MNPALFSSLIVLALAIAALYQVHRPFDGLLLMDNSTDDDSDMKIAGVPPAPERPDETEKELELHKQNGNLKKAYALSTELAKKIMDEDGGTTFGLDTSESDEVRMQRRLLLAFVVDYSIDSKIKGILGQVVLNDFYDNLKNNVPDFYEDIRESGSFSYYFLCVRNNGNVEHCIGNSFARLAGCEGDSVMAELGEALYYHFKDIVENTIQHYQFIS